MRVSLVILMSILGLNSHASLNQWKNFRKNSQNQAIVNIKTSSLEKTTLKPTVKKTDGLIWGTAVFDVSGFYVGSADKRLYYFDNNLNQKWNYQIFDRADSLIDSASLITNDGQVIIPGGDGYLHSVDKTSGLKNWVFKADGADDGTHQSGVIVNSFEGNVTQGPDQTIYAGSDNGYMYALNLDGTLKWKFRTDMMIWSSPAFDKENNWMVFGSLDNYVYLLNPQTGELLDKFKAKGEVKSSPTISYKNGKAFIYIGSSSGRFYKFEVVTKRKGLKLKKKWSFKAGAEVYSSPVFFNGRVYFGSLDGKMYALNENGKLAWTYDTHSTISSSPLITKDEVLVFGAKNAKLYALNAKLGERIWSYKTSNSNIKSNLDASPVMRNDGLIVNGSYSGHIYFVPYTYCLNVEDKRCEFGGVEDIPEFVNKLDDGTHFLLADREGRLNTDLDKKVPLASVLRLKLVVKKDDHWISNAGLNPVGLKVRLNGKKVPYRVSTDGKYLNIYPEKMFEASTEYELTVKGTYFKKTNWFWDRFKYLFLPKVRASFKYKTKEANSNINWLDQLKVDKAIGVRSLYLYQPATMDTYIPAALDGQFFLMKLVEASDEGSIKVVVFPAFYSNDSYHLMKETSKVFTLEGSYLGSELHLSGSFKISAMGGTIPFEIAQFFVQFNGQKVMGELVTESKCTKLQGNGVDFKFPMSIVDNTCDHRLRLIGVGKFDGEVTTIEQLPQLDYFADDNLIIFERAPHLTGSMLTLVYETKNGTHIQNTILNETQNFVKFEYEPKNTVHVFLNGQRM